MREMTESVLRFTWAMSLVGLRQAANAFLPRGDWKERSRRELDALSATAAREMGETMRAFYRAGDRCQAGALDTASRLFSAAWSRPGARLNEVWEALDRTRAAARGEKGGGRDA